MRFVLPRNLSGSGAATSSRTVDASSASHLSHQALHCSHQILKVVADIGRWLSEACVHRQQVADVLIVCSCSRKQPDPGAHEFPLHVDEVSLLLECQPDPPTRSREEVCGNAAGEIDECHLGRFVKDLQTKFTVFSVCMCSQWG